MRAGFLPSPCTTSLPARRPLRGICRPSRPAIHRAPSLRAASSRGAASERRRARRPVACCSVPLLPDPLPEGLQLEAVPDDASPGVVYDEQSKTVKIPLKELSDSRRTKLVMFTCNKCGGRSARLVNPLAWEKGVVFAQCQHCEVWHTLASNNPAILEEVRYERGGGSDGSGGEGGGLLERAGSAGTGDSIDSSQTGIAGDAGRQDAEASSGSSGTGAR